MKLDKQREQRQLNKAQIKNSMEIKLSVRMRVPGLNKDYSPQEIANGQPEKDGLVLKEVRYKGKVRKN